MKRKLLFVLFAATFSCFAALPPEKVGSSAAFICGDNPNYPDGKQPLGTCFGVGIRGTNGLYAGNIVTARHVLFGDDMHNKQPAPNLSLRVNQWSGGVGYAMLSFTGTNALKIYTHPDPSVDLAVIAGSVDEKIGDFPLHPIDRLLTREQVHDQKIREGDDIFFIGLFSNFYGQNRNYSIMRFGRVGMMPGERIPIAPGLSAELFLLDVQTYRGNSGAPAFIDLNAARLGQIVNPRSDPYISGVVSRVYLAPAEVVPEKPSTNRVDQVSYYARQMNGVAGVVPSYLVRDILELDALQKQHHLK